ncbi:hypothetical protein BC832DRAFT_197302 [Gaertneriomyces semiglobifer]|nr:hypothetical protein BC832DRAFT_197302 [Gaertneriomyces semiglobifer]
MPSLSNELFLRNEDFPLWLSGSSWVLTLLSIPIALSGFVLDASLLYVFARTRSLWSGCNILIMLGLISSQFLFGGTAAAYYIFNAVHHAFVSPTECRIEAVLVLCGGSASVIATTAIAIERYYSIVKQDPLRGRGTAGLLCTVWSIGLFIGLFPLFSGTIAPRPTRMTCTAAWYSREPMSMVYSLFCLCALGGSMALTAMVYWKTFQVVRAASRSLQQVMKSKVTMATKVQTVADLEGPAIEGTEDNRRFKRWSAMVFHAGRFLLVGGGGDSEIERVEKETVGSKNSAKHKQQAADRAARKDALERIVFQRSLRIVTIFMLCWACHSFMFIYEITSGKNVPYTLDVLAHSLVMCGGVINSMVLLTDNRQLKNAYFEQYPFLKFLRRGGKRAS